MMLTRPDAHKYHSSEPPSDFDSADSPPSCIPVNQATQVIGHGTGGGGSSDGRRLVINRRSGFGCGRGCHDGSRALRGLAVALLPPQHPTGGSLCWCAHVLYTSQKIHTAPLCPPPAHTRTQAKGLPQVRQFVSHFSLLQAVLPKCLMRYDRAFYKTSVALFAAMDTPLLAFVSAGYLGVYVNEAHLFREVSDQTD